MKLQDTHLFFSESDLFAQISVAQNRLLEMKQAIDFDAFYPVLKEKLKLVDGVTFNATKWHPLFLFKCVLLGSMFHYSDAQLEYQLKNRLDFKMFLDLEAMGEVPDEKTIWDFREKLIKNNAEKELFNSFNDQLKLHGFCFEGEHIIDGTLHECEHRCTSPKTDEMIKQGHLPESRSSNPKSLSQTDLDASWKTKGKNSYFGYLGLVMVLKKYKFITSYHVDSAHVDERVNVPELVKDIFVAFKIIADKGFVSEGLKETMRKLGFNFVAMQKEYQFSSDCLEIRAENKLISKVRARVEHVFGNITQAIGSNKLRTIGIERNSFQIGMRYMIHNMLRFVSIQNGRA
jgi:IS5 family transposase